MAITQKQSDQRKSQFRTRKELERTSPSVRDGISAQREEAKRLAYTSLLQEAGVALRLPQPAIATATVYCHQFYASKSMRTNNTWVVATACLFLAAKVEEVPKAMKDIIVHMWSMKHRGDAAMLELMQSKEWQDNTRAAVLKAERALMYANHFDFNVSHPYWSLLSFIKHYNFTVQNQSLPQTAWNLVNLSLRTTLCLQYKYDQIAAAAVYLSMKLYRMPTPQLDGWPWYMKQLVVDEIPLGPVEPDTVQDIAAQLLEVAEKLRRFQTQRTHPKEHASLLSQMAEIT